MLDFDIKEQFLVMRQALAPLQLSRWQMTKLLVAQIFRQMSTTQLIIIAAPFVLLTAYFLDALFRRRPKVDLPLVGGTKDHTNDFQAVVEEGRRLYPHTPYLVQASGVTYVVFPATAWDEIKRLPQSVASTQEFFRIMLYGDYTNIGTETDALIKTIGVDLARGVPLKVHRRQQDCQKAFDTTIGHCPEWKPVTILMAMFNIIATMNACSFVGRELGESDTWVKTVQRFPMSVMVASFTISKCPRFLRPILAPLLFVPSLYLQWKMKSMLAPIIKEDMLAYERAADKKEHLKVTENGKVPFTGWLMSRYKAGQATAKQIAIDYLITGFESTPSSAATLYNIVADLAVRPETVEMLREEIATVMKDGKLPLTHLQELKKMDSVMRESIRMNPFSLFSLYRVAKKPFRVSNGPEIPAGAMICVDSHHINSDPKHWEKPDVYDDLRHFNLRHKDGNDSRHLFVTTGPDSPNFGDGTQSCPGRLFASSTIKIALTYMLLNYDIKLKDGEGRPKKVSMPNGSWAPDFKADVLFKSRRAEESFYVS